MQGVDVAILAGGEGRRLGGVAKALMEAGGETLVVRVLKRLRSVARSIIVVVGASGGPPGLQGFLATAAGSTPTRLLTDVHGSAGLPGAMLTALDACTAEWCLVVGADMPYADPDLAGELMILRRGVDAVVPVRGTLVEPLHGLYRVEGCRGPLTAMVASGEGRLGVLLNAVRVERREIPPPRAGGADPFFKVTTAADLAAATARDLSAA